MSADQRLPAWQASGWHQGRMFPPEAIQLQIAVTVGNADTHATYGTSMREFPDGDQMALTVRGVERNAAWKATIANLVAQSLEDLEAAFEPF